MENGSVVAIEPDCSTVPIPLCEREGEYVLDVVEEGACCPKKICGEFNVSGKQIKRPLYEPLDPELFTLCIRLNPYSIITC